MPSVATLQTGNSAAIAGGPFYGPLRFPPGFTVYKVRNGDIDRGTFVPIDSLQASPAGGGR